MEKSKETIKRMYRELENIDKGYIDEIKDLEIPKCVDNLTIQYMLNRLYYMVDKLTEMGFKPEELIKDDDIKYMISLYGRLSSELEKHKDPYEDKTYVEIMEEVEKYDEDPEDIEDDIPFSYDITKDVDPEDPFSDDFPF